MKASMDDIAGVVGIVPTPAVPEASHWSTELSVNLDETARMIRLVEDAGIRILLTNGTFGEGSSMTERDEQAFADCIVQTARPDMLLFAGITTLNTRETIRRARALLGLGATGLFLGRPMWLSLDQADIVRYYADIAEALPGVPLILYDNPLTFKGPIEAETYRALSRNRAIIASKHAGSTIERDLQAVEGRIRLLPMETVWVDHARAHPNVVTACWSGSIACAPEASIMLADAIARQDWATAEGLSARMGYAERAMFPDGSLQKFIDYSVQIAHARFAAAGLIDPGPPRPPYLSAPEAYIEGAHECGRRWRALRAELMRDAAAMVGAAGFEPAT